MGVFSGLKSVFKSRQVERVDAVLQTDNTDISKRSITGLGWEAIKSIFLGQNKSGVSANANNVLGLPAAFACIRHVSEAAAIMPIHVHKRVSDGQREYVSGHIAARLLNMRSNRITNAFDLRRDLIAMAMIYPCAYLVIERNQVTAAPIQLWIVKPSDINEILNTAGTNRFYKVKGYEQLLYEEDVIRVTNIFGRSVVSILNVAFGTAIATQSFAAQYFANNGNVSKYITTPNGTKNANQKDTLESDVSSKFGPNAKGLPLLEWGMEIKELKGVSMSEAQALETRKWNSEDVCRVFKVPPAIIGIETGARYNSVEAMNQAFIQSAVLPWLTVLEQEFHEKLLTYKEQKDHYFRFQTSALMKADLKSRIESYDKMIRMGMITINEARELEDYNKVEGGDVPFVQVNQIPLNKAEEYAQNLIDKGHQPGIDNTVKQ